MIADFFVEHKMHFFEYFSWVLIGLIIAIHMNTNVEIYSIRLKPGIVNNGAVLLTSEMEELNASLSVYLDNEVKIEDIVVGRIHSKLLDDKGNRVFSRYMKLVSNNKDAEHVGQNQLGLNQTDSNQTGTPQFNSYMLEFPLTDFYIEDEKCCLWQIDLSNVVQKKTKVRFNIRQQHQALSLKQILFSFLSAFWMFFAVRAIRRYFYRYRDRGK